MSTIEQDVLSRSDLKGLVAERERELAEQTAQLEQEQRERQRSESELQEREQRLVEQADALATEALAGRVVRMPNGRRGWGRQE